jgi:hypothetical protein
MANLDEGLLQDLKSLTRWWPALQERLAWRFSSMQVGIGEQATNSAEMETLSAQDGEPELTGVTNWPPTLEALIQQCSPLPANGVILGICDDGLPFVLDLTNPAPGALVILSDSYGARKRLLNAILASATYLNSEEELAFNLFVNDQEGFHKFAQFSNCRHIVTIHENTSTEVADVIRELAVVTEARRRSRPVPPDVILAIDDLSSCLQIIDDETFAQLYWLVKHGPRSRVWTIAAMDALQSRQIEPRLLASFRTRLIGSVEDDELGRYLTGGENLVFEETTEADQFYVPYSDNWVRFWVCDPDPSAWIGQ